MPALAQTGLVRGAVVPGERLSDWLLRNAGPNTDATALHWQVPAERLAQGLLRQAVVNSLRAAPLVALSAPAKATLSDWLLAMPLTGRLTLAIADARWLQGVPSEDPVLQDGHRVVLAQRPTTVTVVTQAARPCFATHTAGALIQDYLRACMGAEHSAQADWAWVAQPDGRTARYGIAPWSLQPQDEPAPGAWIWAPDRASGIPNAASDNLARFLATQLAAGPSAWDALPRTVEARAKSDAPPRAAQYTASDWGEIGLMQTPTARMAPTGAARLHIGKVTPYLRGNVMLQPLDWLETGFRYSDVSNRLYGPDVAGRQPDLQRQVD